MRRREVKRLLKSFRNIRRMYCATLLSSLIIWLAVFPADKPRITRTRPACNVRFIIARIAGLDNSVRIGAFINFTRKNNRINPLLRRMILSL